MLDDEVVKGASRLQDAALPLQIVVLSYYMLAQEMLKMLLVGCLAFQHPDNLAVSALGVH